MIIASMIGCKGDLLDIDLSTSTVNIEVRRSEKQVFNLNDSTQIAHFGEFLPLYGQYVLGIGHPNEVGFHRELRMFASNNDMRTLYAESEDVFDDNNILNASFSKAFSYYSYHFPDSVIPQVITNISGLNYPVFVGDSTLGVGLDMFLGSDFEVYPLAGFPEYLSRTMTPEYVVSRSMYGWIQSMYEETSGSQNMLEQMVFHGKLLYTMDALLYAQPDSIKSGFSEEDLKWCDRNEVNIWSVLIDKDLLYTTDHMSISKWIEPAPFTSGIPQESPGQLGRWVGWQMVRAFMEQHPETTLPQLFTDHEAQKILTLSKYKPK